MEQFRFDQAIEQFQKARQADPRFLPAAVNLGIALFYDRQAEPAVRALEDVLSRNPGQIEALYTQALVLRSIGRNRDALRNVELVLRSDPHDPAALYLAAALEISFHRLDSAVLRLRKALERDPWNVSVYYSLAKALLQKGEAEEGEKAMARFQELKSRGTGTSFGSQYLEQGRYARAVQAESTDGTEGSVSESKQIRFVDMAAAAGLSFTHSGPIDEGSLVPHLTSLPGPISASLAASFGSGAAFLDYDGDGRPDLFLVNAGVSGPAPSALYRNAGNGEYRLASSTGAEFNAMGMGVAAGDYDSDGRTDLFISGFRRSGLFHNEGGGKFRETTRLLAPSYFEGIWALTAGFADLDHDGDLDLFGTGLALAPGGQFLQGDGRITGGQNFFFRNNGNGTFTEIGRESGIRDAQQAWSFALLDYNDSRDVDVLVLGSPWRLFSNNRDGSFTETARDAKLAVDRGTLGVAAADFDSDEWTDIASAQPDVPGVMHLAWGAETKFEFSDIRFPAPEEHWNIHSLDYDNDGDLDLLVVGKRLRLMENIGRRAWRDSTSKTGLDQIDASGARSVAQADYDLDGDVDLLVTRCGRKPLLLRNDGGNRSRALRLALKGKTDNRAGFGSKIDWAAGSLWQHREWHGNLGYLSQSAVDIHLGLGKYEVPDYVRILWPSGVLQTESLAESAPRAEITELDRKGTSCPILYAWNGSRFEFVTDFLGGSAVGYLVAPGQYSVPDTDEYVKIRYDQLRSRNGSLTVKMVNQLEEIILFDKVRLIAADHPATVEIQPNERLQSRPPFPEFGIFSSASTQPVRAAKDGHGRTWTDRLVSLDRKYVEGFPLLPFKGYSEPHELVVELGDLRGAKRILLFMDGWIDYATSSSNFAASQAGLKLVAPYLEELGEDGRWRKVLDDMGFPAGLPKTMAVDLTGKLRGARNVTIRIVTNMRIYWDRIRLDTKGSAPDYCLHTLKPAKALTSWIGYPMPRSPDGKPPFEYDFSEREALPLWKRHAGGHSPMGDVLDLLEEVDDCYVVLPHGEGITAEFSDRELHDLPPGWVRDWLLYVDGFGKDMDPHSAHPDSIEPLPRHRGLPYRHASWRLLPDRVWRLFQSQRLSRTTPW